VSEPTYRIEVTMRPWEAAWYNQACASVFRLSDDAHVAAVWGATAGEALRGARQWVLAQDLALPPDTFYVGDDGQDVEHSVKA